MTALSNYWITWLTYWFEIRFTNQHVKKDDFGEKRVLVRHMCGARASWSMSTHPLRKWKPIQLFKNIYLFSSKLISTPTLTFGESKVVCWDPTRMKHPSTYMGLTLIELESIYSRWMSLRRCREAWACVCGWGFTHDEVKM
jgi:hypothetical protein